MRNNAVKLPDGYEFIPENEWHQAIQNGWKYLNSFNSKWETIDNLNTTILKISQSGRFKYFCRPIPTQEPETKVPYRDY